MICNNCNKNIACYHSTMVINGISRTEHLCSECYDKLNRKNVFAEMKDILFGNIFNFNWDIGNPAYSFSSNGSLINDAIHSINIGAKKCMENNSSYRIQDLKKQMQEAIDREDYETAGKIKKQLDEFRG